ncbi:hypothetical protein LTR08_008328 [Meristemomyces frigidus]|nr:hypothetical protein LTR08_008328 [Meristemomyces frigidus]
MHIYHAFELGIAVLALLGATNAGHIADSEPAIPRGSPDPDLAPALVPTESISSLLPVTKILDDVQVASQAADCVVERSRKALHWCKVFFDDKDIHDRTLTWQPEIINLTSDLRSLCIQLVPLQRLEVHRAFQTTEEEVNVANNTMRLYRETGSLAADDFLRYHWEELHRVSDALAVVLRNLQQLSRSFDRMYEIGHKLFHLCRSGSAEPCWSKEYHLRFSWDHTDGTWSTEEYQPMLKRQQVRFVDAMADLCIRTRTSSYLTDFVDSLLPVHDEIKVRMLNVSYVLEMDVARDPQPVIQLLLTTIQRYKGLGERTSAFARYTQILLAVPTDLHIVWRYIDAAADARLLAWATVGLVN